MKTYFTVIPLLKNKDGFIHDFRLMKPLAIVALNTLGLHIYTTDTSPYKEGTTDEAVHGLYELLQSTIDKVGTSDGIFSEPVSIKQYTTDTHGDMIISFLEDMKVYGVNTLHSWNLSFDIQTMNYGCSDYGLYLDAIIEAVHKNIFVEYGKELETLHLGSTRTVPTTGNLKFIDGVTTIGIPTIKGINGSLTLTSVFNHVTGMKHVPYWYLNTGHVVGLEKLSKVQEKYPMGILTEELYSLYQLKYLTEKEMK